MTHLGLRNRKLWCSDELLGMRIQSSNSQTAYPCWPGAYLWRLKQRGAAKKPGTQKVPPRNRHGRVRMIFQKSWSAPGKRVWGGQAQEKGTHSKEGTFNTGRKRSTHGGALVEVQNLPGLCTQCTPPGWEVSKHLSRKSVLEKFSTFACFSTRDRCSEVNSSSWPEVPTVAREKVLMPL